MSPAVGATDVDVRTKVTMTFDRAIDPASIQVYLMVGVNFTRVNGGGVYDAASRTFTFFPSTPNTYTALDYGLPAGTNINVYVGAGDTAGNVLPVGPRGNFTTRACPCSVWPDTATPGTASVAPGGPVELGVKFSAGADGYITGLRYYKGPNNTGTHVGRLWRTDSQLLGSATFTDETATGWQRVDFWPPVAVGEYFTYVASYTAPTVATPTTAASSPAGASPTAR
jgi:hypothetical protein